MKNECLIEGQISIFELSTMEVSKPKEIIIKEETKEIDKFDNIIKLYSKSCSRIVKTLSGALLVELADLRTVSLHKFKLNHNSYLFNLLWFNFIFIQCNII